MKLKDINLQMYNSGPFGETISVQKYRFNCVSQSSSDTIEGALPTVTMIVYRSDDPSSLHVEVDADNKVLIPDTGCRTSWVHSLSHGTFYAEKEFIVSCLVARDIVLGIEPSTKRYERLTEIKLLQAELDVMSPTGPRRAEIQKDLKDLQFLSLCEEDPDLKFGWDAACEIAPGSDKKDIEDAKLFVKNHETRVTIFLLFLKFLSLIFCRRTK